MAERSLAFSAAVLILLLLSSTAVAQDRSAADQRPTPFDRFIGDAFVVSLETLPDHQFGSGIVLGFDNEALYVLTAGHLFPKNPKPGGTTVRAQFYWQGRLARTFTRGGLDPDATSIPTSVMGVGYAAVTLVSIVDALPPGSDHNIDLGIVVLSTEKMFIGTDMSILGNPDWLISGDAVSVMGNPRGEGLISADSKLLSVELGDIITFEASALRPGFSGGILFDDERRPIGLITSSAPPVGRALRLDRLVGILQEAEFPFDKKAWESASILSVDPTVEEPIVHLKFEDLASADPRALEAVELVIEPKAYESERVTYGVARVDLNGDDRLDYLVQVQSNGVCGSRGCSYTHIGVIDGPDGLKKDNATPDCGSEVAVDQSRHGFLRMFCWGLRDRLSRVPFALAPPWSARIDLHGTTTSVATTPEAIEPEPSFNRLAFAVLLATFLLGAVSGGGAVAWVHRMHRRRGPYPDPRNRNLAAPDSCPLADGRPSSGAEGSNSL
jgi:hypothetical protein